MVNHFQPIGCLNFLVEKLHSDDIEVFEVIEDDETSLDIKVKEDETSLEID